MIQPYASGKRWTLYRGDCLDVLAAGLIPGDASIISDPPYGVSLNTAYAKAGRSVSTPAHDFAPVHGDDHPFDPAPWLVFPRVVLFGANYYADRLPPSGSWLVWDKRDGICENDHADAELAWMRGGRGTVPRLLHHAWIGMVRASERGVARVHPTQKPIEVMSWALRWLAPPPDSLIADGYLGSGTTGVAALLAGHRFLGVDIEPAYLNIAARRLEQAEGDGVQLGLGLGGAA